jgi:hypothetical protein
MCSRFRPVPLKHDGKFHKLKVEIKAPAAFLRVIENARGPAVLGARLEFSEDECSGASLAYWQRLFRTHREAGGSSSTTISAYSIEDCGAICYDFVALGSEDWRSFGLRAGQKRRSHAHGNRQYPAPEWPL